MIGSTEDERTAFVLANTTQTRPTFIPEIALRLADEAHGLWHKTEEEQQAIGLPPPFWAFAWAGGQGLARYLLNHPDIARGRKVLDFATGSGLVAIAAVMAGPAQVTAADIDPYSASAAALNFALNAVEINFHLGDLVGTDDGWDMVLAGDIFYDRAFCDQALPWLRGLAKRGATVLVGDPGRAYLPNDLDSMAVYFVPVSLAIEDDDIKRTTVWRF